MDSGPLEARPLTADEADQAIIPWEMPPLKPEEIKSLCASENRAMLATFLG